MKFAHNGKSVACGQWTSKMKTHFRVSVTHCSDNDTFYKETGKWIAENRFISNRFIVLPAKCIMGNNTATLKQQLKLFLELNC